MSSIDSPNHENWISIYKGIAILLVVLGHLEIPETLYRVIFSFHMYAFFFIAGVTFHDNKPFKIYFKDSVRRLLIPYFVFAFAWDITHLVQVLYLQGEIDLSLIAIIKNIISVLLCENIGHSNASIGPAWFLYCLLFVRMEYYLIRVLAKYFNARHLTDVICIILFIVGYCCNGIEGVPFKILPAQTALIFFHIGFIWKNRDDKSFSFPTKAKPFFCIFCFALTLLSLLSNSEMRLVSNVYPDNIALLLIPAFSGTFALLYLSQWIEHSRGVFGSSSLHLGICHL